MKPKLRVAINLMSDTDARSLLERTHVGRIAFSLHDRVEIEPISYVCVGDWIYLRTSHGSKTRMLSHHPWVAFQVDDIRSYSEWESVVVHGRIQTLSDDGAAVERTAYNQALASLHTIDPHALSANDPVPHRYHVLRLHLDEVTGRRATEIGP